MKPPFANEPVLELRRAPVRESLTAALAELDARLPLRGAAARTAPTEGFESTDPGDPSRVVATAGRASAEDAAAAVVAAARGLPRVGRHAGRRSGPRRWCAPPPRCASAGSSWPR